MRLPALPAWSMRSVFTSSTDRRRFIPCTSKLPNGWQLRRSRAGVERLAHVSGIGADAASPSLYIRKRGEGELAVRAAFADAILIRPAVMFGPDDAFLTTILELLRRLPIYPMFGRGLTRLQPVYVEDVAEAIARALRRTQTQAMHVRVRRPSRLLLRGIAQSHRQRGRTQAHLDSGPICRLARAGMDRGNAAKPAHHSKSSGTDAGRQRVIAGHARIWRTWNFPARGRGNTPGDVMGSLIKELLRLVRSKMAPAEGR